MDSEEVVDLNSVKGEVFGLSSHLNPSWNAENSYVLRRCSDYDPLPDDLRGVITLDAIREARIVINKEGFVRETPIIDGITINGPRKSSKIGHLKSFGMKCENMQFSGSFKIRGASYQFSQFPNVQKQNLVTISAGNYGTAFGMLAKELGIARNATVFMPNTVPQRRKERIEAFGVNVNCEYHQSELMIGVDKDMSSRNSAFLHPFDDIDVILGHASAGLELLKQEPLVDVILVCCGGGGFLAGITAAIRLSGNTRTKVYGVEHVISCTMFDSLVGNKMAVMKQDPGKTICHGISAPCTGKIPFKVFRALGDGVIKLEEDDIKRTVKLLYEMGLVVEPSGAAAVAAVLCEKVPDIAGKNVVAFITGGNVSPQELQEKCGVNI